LVGCAGRQEFIPPEPNAEEYAPPTLDYTLPETQSGSLYRHQYTMTLFQDRRAYRVGDVLTVQLSEETSSSKNAGTKCGKSSAINFLAPTIGTKTIDELGVSVDGKRNFDGSASSSQGNKL
ncbi:flagellar basal body L-ring protein FlgH, partial [Escherichia coli]|nr:flagellar basal body L-ring protein FlgH [Escherichia coli]